MAVLVEGVSVLISVESIHTKLSGGWDRFVRMVPSNTFCHDGELAQVSFTASLSAQQYIDKMESFGLTFLIHGRTVDIVVCDQRNGLETDCDWAQFVRLPYETGEVGIAWKRYHLQPGTEACIPSANLRMVAPAGWQYPGSLSNQYQ